MFIPADVEKAHTSDYYYDPDPPCILTLRRPMAAIYVGLTSVLLAASLALAFRMFSDDVCFGPN